MNKFNESLDREKLKKVCLGCIAKTKTENKEGTEVKKGLPLWMHLTDTAMMMDYIFTHRVSRHEKDQLYKATQSDEITRNIFILLGGLHDIGKVSSIFQAKMVANLRLENFPLPLISHTYRNSKAHHARLGTLILCSLGYKESFASICGAHHGRTQEPILKKEEEIIQTEAREWLFGPKPSEDQIADWKRIWEGISEVFLKACGFSNPQAIPQLEPYQLMILAGYLSAADWLASNSTYFPLIEKTNFEKGDWYPKRIEMGEEAIGFPKAWSNPRKEAIPNFQTLFDLPQPNPFQQAVLEGALSIKQPGLLILEAPMGSGKTEAALMAADVFTQKAKSGGVFIGLPTQASANGLLERFKNWATNETDSMIATFMLAHGAATLNAPFQDMRRTENLVDEDGDVSGKLVIHKWMDQNRLSLFSDFVIGTIDQALMSTLNCRYVALRHPGLAGKTLILDEVHAYDAYTSSFLTNFLTWMGLYNVPVILLSATLLENKRIEFIEAYLKGKNGMKKVKWNKSLASGLAYPRITWTSDLNVDTKNDLIWEEKREVQILKTEANNHLQVQEVIKKYLEDYLSEGGCAGIIVNTIRKAQDLFLYLKKEMPTYQIYVIHSGYRHQDREKIESKLRTLLGKNSTPKQRDKLIVIGTQVLEQSLDIDFDFMISELAPMELLLQRMGRLFRHHRNRPKKLSSPHFVLLDTSNDTVDSSSELIYGKWPLRQSRRFLSSEISLPDDISNLVKQAYEPASSADKSWKEYLIDQQHEKNKADQWILYPPKALKSTKTKGLNGLMKSQNIYSEGQAQLSVRDVGPSIEFSIFTYNEVKDKKEEDKWTFLEIRNRLLTWTTFDADEFSHEVKIWMKNNGIAQKIPKELQNNLVVCFKEESNEVHIGKWKVKYSTEYGLTVECPKT